PPEAPPPLRGALRRAEPRSAEGRPAAGRHGRRRGPPAARDARRGDRGRPARGARQRRGHRHRRGRAVSGPVTVSFFGGLGEIGANMCAVEADGRIAVIDTGLTFPDAEHHGIDLILPDWQELRSRADGLECVVLAHGHEDHIGALPFVLRDFPGVPIYASKLTLALARAKLVEHPDVKATMIAVEAGE